MKIMCENKMINLFKYLLFMFVICLSFFISGSVVFADGVLESGTYKSSDEHTIIIDDAKKVLYDSTYSLTLTSNVKGDKITGKIGTNNKAITFYQLNDSNIVSTAVINYTHGGSTVYLYDYTVFSKDSTPIVDPSGAYELWRDGSKIDTYADLQDVIDAAKSGDTVKLNKNVDLTGGSYIKGKSITIDGNGNTLNSANWLNSVFVVEEGATLAIKNLKIDGGATGFEVDKSAINIQTGTSTKIPIKTGSDTSDPKKNVSLIITRGVLNVSDSKFNNNYLNGNGAVINGVAGEINLDNSEFIHNRSSNGGALYIGSNFKVDQTKYSVSKLAINDCKFEKNYAGNGGAILVYNTEKVDLTGTDFIENTVSGGKGGAILINNQSGGGYYSMAEKFNLDFMNFNMDDCKFDGNWVGNDGSAIENHDANMVINNTKFINNVGIHSTSSCGTLSIASSEIREVTIVVKNSLFKHNLGSASTLADHGTYVRFDVSNTDFISNRAVYNSMLLYSANAVFKDCVFEDEYVSRAIIDIQGYGPEFYSSEPRTIVFDNVQFNNTAGDSTDILLRKMSANVDNFDTTVIFKGDTKAKIDVWNGNILKIYDNYTGVVNKDDYTPTSKIIVDSNAKVNGEILNNEDTHLITLIYNDVDKVDGYNWELRKYVYVDKELFTRGEFFVEHFLEKDGYELVFYTDKAFTTKWNYEVTGDINLYGRWEQHSHVYDGFIVYNNAIHEQCECGYLGNSISIEVPSDLVYNGKEKKVIINNELNIPGDDLEIVYYNQDGNGELKKIKGAPVNEGDYKVIVSYNGLSIEKEYSITKKVVKPDTSVDIDDTNNDVDNPDTSDNIVTVMIFGVLSFVCIVVVLLYKKKYIHN